MIQFLSNSFQSDEKSAIIKGKNTRSWRNSRMQDLAENGRDFYDRNLKALFEPERNGEFVALDPETGNYFLGATGREALAKAEAAFPDRQFYLQRVGYRFAHSFAGVKSQRWQAK